MHQNQKIDKIKFSSAFYWRDFVTVKSALGLIFAFLFFYCAAYSKTPAEHFIYSMLCAGFITKGIVFVLRYRGKCRSGLLIDLRNKTICNYTPAEGVVIFIPQIKQLALRDASATCGTAHLICHLKERVVNLDVSYLNKETAIEIGILIKAINPKVKLDKEFQREGYR